MAGSMKVAWVGVGVMGRSMVQHLVGKGHEVRVFTRSKDKISSLLQEGKVTWCGSPAEAADGADVGISMVGYPEDVRQVVLGTEGFLSAKTRPRAVIDMTTSTPSLAREISTQARGVGVESIDAPVSGGDIGERNAALSIMVGGSER